MKLIEKIAGPTFEKMAGKVLLGDNPSTYPSELVASLYKQHPYLGKYQVNISIEGQDPSMGYMYGVFLVSSASDVPPEQGQRRMGEVINQGQEPPKPEQSVRIPIIVSNKRAYSFDVFISSDGRFMPLNEARISSALFEASPFAVAPTPTQSQAAAPGAIMPSGAQGREAPMNATTKMASALFKNISKAEVQDFVKGISKQASLANAYELNPVFKDALHRMVEASSEVVVEKIASADFTSAVISKTSGGFNIKTSSNLDVGSTVTISNKEAEAALPVEIRQQVIKTGAALMVPETNTGLEDISFTEDLGPVLESGIYAVMTKTGNSQRAAVLKGTTRLDGSRSDNCVVVGGAGASYQEKVAGIRCGDVDIERIEGREPFGEGVFVLKEAGVVVEPVKVLHTIYQDDGVTYSYSHPLRGIGHLKVAAVNSLVQVDDNTQMIPEDFAFVPLEFGARYSDDAVSMDKIAARQSYMNGVSLVSNGSEYSFRGAHIDHIKLANLSHEDALLTLSDFGDTPNGAYKKLEEAKNGKTPRFVARLPQVEKTAGITEDEYLMVGIAQEIRSNLVKEASVFTTAETVDSVLSLNFITPENVAGYVDSIPAFEEAGSKLAELLIGVRLGLSDVPEAAVSSALGGIERAIKGLKKLQVRANLVE